MKEIVKQEIRGVFRLNSHKRHWSIPVLAALCVGIPLFVGLIIGNFSSALSVSLGGLVILYMPSNSNFVGSMTKLLLCSFGFMISYGIGVTFSFNPIISCITFGVFSAVIHWVLLLFRVKPPGSFFFIMLASMASGLPFNIGLIPEKIGLVAMGSLLACFLALICNLILKKPDLIKESKEIINEVIIKKDSDYVEAFIVGIFMFCSMLIGHVLEFKNPYWIPISCLAVMQGATTFHIWRRGGYRILGTALGMVLCWGILLVLKEPFEICLAIIVLQFIIESIVTRNYTLAVLFITPMTILLSEAGSPSVEMPTELLVSRLIDVLIGSCLGAFGGWVIYHEKLKNRAIRNIRITRWIIKKKH